MRFHTAFIKHTKMMSKKITLSLFFVTLLALFLNLSLAREFLNLDSLLSLVNIDPVWFISIVMFVSIIGAVCSFIFSDIIARFMLGVTLIKQPSSYLENWLFTSVQRQSRQLGIEVPKIGVFYASDLNAFTTGRGQNTAMFAVSSGLLETMDEQELDAVIGHELAHIASNDMISLAVTQGLVASITELPARLSGFLIDKLIFRRNSQGGFTYHCVYWCCMLTMGILPHFIVAWFSRKREFSADNTSVLLNGADKMASALKRLLLSQSLLTSSKQITALGFNNILLERLVGGVSNVKNIFSSHPSLNKRISLVEALKAQ